MSLRKLTASIVAVVAAGVSALALTGSVALAAPLYGFQSSFGSFANVESIAVDSSTGDLYVYDASEGGKVYRFDAAGNPVEFASTGSNAISGVGTSPYGGAGEVQVAVDSSAGVSKGDI
jgi:hypothetical protein